jgi:ABC-2 type transport system permease protein
MAPVALTAGPRGVISRIAALAWKDTRQVLRERRSVLALVVMPILFTAFMGFAYRPSLPGADAPLRVGVVRQDEGPLALRLEDVLRDDPGITLVRAPDAPAASTWVTEGRLAAALVIPGDLQVRLAAHEPPGLVLLADPSSAPGQRARAAALRAVLRLAAASEAAHQALRALGAENAPAASEGRAASRAAPGWLEVAARAFDDGSALAPSLAIERPPVAAAPAPALVQAAPGMVVMFTLLGLIRSALVLVQERRQGTLARLLTTATSRATLLAGHLLGVFSVVFAQGLILVVAGQLAFGLDYLHAPLATGTLLAALSLWVAALAIFVGATARSPEQVVLFGFIATILFCALGGAWFPLESTGGAFAAVGARTPAAWAMKGLRAIIGGEASHAPVWTASLVLAGYAVAFFVPAALKSRAE